MTVQEVLQAYEKTLFYARLCLEDARRTCLETDPYLKNVGEDVAEYEIIVTALQEKIAREV